MKIDRPYKARQLDGDKPEILFEESVAHYLTQPQFDTLYQAEKVATMLNDAREMGYRKAKNDLNGWLNG